MEAHLLPLSFVVLQVHPTRRAQQICAGVEPMPRASPAPAVPPQAALGEPRCDSRETTSYRRCPLASVLNADKSLLTLAH